MLRHPEFPKLILKVLALNHGPGRRFIQSSPGRGRSRGTRRVEGTKSQGIIHSSMDPDLLRISFVGQAMTPMPPRDIVEEQAGQSMDADILQRLADVNGCLFATGLASEPCGSGGPFSPRADWPWKQQSVCARSVTSLC